MDEDNISGYDEEKLIQLLDKGSTSMAECIQWMDQSTKNLDETVDKLKPVYLLYLNELDLDNTRVYDPEKVKNALRSCLVIGYHIGVLATKNSPRVPDIFREEFEE